MTLVIAWTRVTGQGRELWIMSDSRLSGGKIWDYGPKIFGIGRSDALVAFAGDTAWTYPLIAQISSYVESFVNLRDRTIDISEAFDLILKVLNESLSCISEPVHPSMRIPDCSFIIAGYSVRRRGFFIRRIVFHEGHGRFESRNASVVGDDFITIIGDNAPMAAFSRRLSDQQRENRKTRFALNMLPAKVFFEVLSSKRFPEIGGAPQVAKLYQHLSQKHFGVYWPPDLPTEQQSIYLRGRRIGRFDVLDHPWVYDPSSAKLFWHDFSPDERRALGKADLSTL